jgi:hypothetical protein
MGIFLDLAASSMGMIEPSNSSDDQGMRTIMVEYSR